MRFSEFLNKLQSETHMKTAAQMFEFLGGEKGLGCTKRSFDLIRSGERNPTASFFHKLFSKLPHPYRKLAIESYFETALENEDNVDTAPLMKFLELNLGPGVPDEHESVWDKNEEKLHWMTAQQLEYMIENHTALRLYNRALLYEKVPNHELISLQDEVKAMNQLGLTVLKRDGLHPKHKVIKIPSHLNSTKRMGDIGMRYVLSHIPAFTRFGGSESQVLSYAIQKIRTDHVDMLMKAINTLKKWMQDLAVSDDEETETVSFVWVGFGKTLNEKDF